MKRRDGISGTADPRWKAALDVEWMPGYDVDQAIPPAYTEWIGKQLMEALNK